MVGRSKEQELRPTESRERKGEQLLKRLVRLVRFELTTPCLKGKCYYRLSYNRIKYKNGRMDRTRTCQRGSYFAIHYFSQPRYRYDTSDIVELKGIKSSILLKGQMLLLIEL